MSGGILPDYPALVFRLNENGLGPELLRQVFLERGWSEFDEDTQEDYDWNLWWRTSRFRTSDYDTVYPWQRLNHYPKSTLITKKDTLARNLKRMKCVHGATVFNFSPLSFNLPNDYTKYVKAYGALRQKSEGRNPYWICKPADLSRGRGIFIFRDLSELLYDCNAVVQQYIENPLLIGGYKFDLRIYVVVTSFQPLRAFVHEEGIARFSTEKFDLSCTKNVFAHLTNTSINKHSPGYTEDKERVGPGCKWTLTQLRHYFVSSNINDQVLWRRIVNIVILTLLVQAVQVQKVENCFELYGFDILVDENLKPWLLEVNFSPSLSADCQADILAKKPMLHHLLDLLHYSSQDAERGGEHFRHYFNTSRQASIQRRTSQLSQIGDKGSSKRGGKVGAPEMKQSRSHSGRPNSSLPGKSRESASFGSPLAGAASVSQENLSGYTNASGIADSRKESGGGEQFGNQTGVMDDGDTDCTRGLVGKVADLAAADQMLEDSNQQPFLPTHLRHDHSKTTISANSHNSGGSEDSKVSMDSGVGSLTKSASSSAKGRHSHLFGSLPEVSAHSRAGSGIVRTDSTSGDELSVHFPSLENSAGNKKSRKVLLTPQRSTYSNITNSSETAERNFTQCSSLSQTRHKSVSTKSLPVTSKEHARQRRQQTKDGNPLTHRSVVSGSLPPTHTGRVSGQRYSTLQHRNQSSMSHYPNMPPSSRIMQPHSRQQRFYPQPKVAQHVNFSQLKKRVGDFFLVFPFNEATNKMTTSLDTKSVIRETQQRVKEALNTVSNAQSSVDPGNHDSGACKETVGLWSPLRADKDET